MNKTVIITGGSGGIGSETVRLFAQKGWQVVFSYHHAENTAGDLMKEIRSRGGNAVAVRCNIADPAETRMLSERAVREFGRITALVNCAGIAQQKLFTDITSADFDRMFDVNVKGVFNCCQSVLPHMIREKNGSIVNVSSMWGISGASCEVHYSASKAAVIGLTKALAKEVGLSGIRVNCVAPGVIDTSMNSNLDADTLLELKNETPLNRIGKPADAASLIYFLAQEESSFMTGQIIGVDGGFII